MVLNIVCVHVRVRARVRICVQMSLLYGQLDEMDSSLDNLQAEVTDIADNDELWPSDNDDQQVTYCSEVAVQVGQCPCPRAHLT